MAQDGSDDDANEAAGAYEQAQKKVRVTSSLAETEGGGVEISIKAPKASADDEDEFDVLLWGTSATTSKVSDDEADTKKKKGTTASNAAGRNRRAGRAEAHVPRPDDASGSTAGTGPATEGKGGEGLWGLARQPTSSKKMQQESRELDKIEAVLLQAKQLQHLLEDSRTVMQVSVKKVREMLTKIEAKRIDEINSMNLDLIKAHGPTCRASEVWENMRETKAMVEAAVEFVEALHDEEASTETLRSKANQVKDLGVKLPQSLSMVMCKRSAELLVSDGKIETFMNFLNPDHSSDIPSGIASVMPENADGNDEKIQQLISDFQSGMVTHCINHIMLKEFTRPTVSPGKPLARLKAM